MSKSKQNSAAGKPEGVKPAGNEAPSIGPGRSRTRRQHCPAKVPLHRLLRAPLAYENPAFLNSADGRLIRIVAEFMEPLARFRREQIQDTVVFFGSARFRGREEADHALELLDNTGSTRPAPSEEQPAKAPEIAAGKASDLQRKRAVAAVKWHATTRTRDVWRNCYAIGPRPFPRASTALSSPPAAAPASWKLPTAALTKPAAKPSA